MPVFTYVRMFNQAVNSEFDWKIGLRIAGRWSSDMPHCEPILCPDIIVNNAKMQLLEHNNTVGGHASFTCMWGNILVGSPIISCRDDGTWNATIPVCSRNKN